jgi:hypothetical protein
MHGGGHDLVARLPAARPGPATRRLRSAPAVPLLPERPTACHVHGRKHGGTLWVDGHHPEEADQVGEIVSHLEGVNEGHEWIVRFDRNLELRWPDGQRIIVNGGAYAPDELEAEE